MNKGETEIILGAINQVGERLGQMDEKFDAFATKISRQGEAIARSEQDRKAIWKKVSEQGEMINRHEDECIDRGRQHENTCLALQRVNKKALRSEKSTNPPKNKSGVDISRIQKIVLICLGAGVFIGGAVGGFLISYNGVGQ